VKDILLGCFGARTRDAAAQAARSTVPVLIRGETGSGKTVLAKLIHQSSSRVRMPFMRVDCGSIPESLFEREMFGHTRGSFTDAKDSQPGLFEAVHGGTLFLDEIGELPLSGQPKLLSVLDDGLVRRIGSTKNTPVDVRIIAASNRDLGEMVTAKQFRADLYYRLGFLKICVPPLRERVPHIPELACHMLRTLSSERADRLRIVPELHATTIACLQAYSWPGNIRELEQALAFAITFFPSPVVLPDHLPPEVMVGGARKSLACSEASAASRYVAPCDPETERCSVVRALELCGGNRTRAAKLLGMSRATLWVKLRQFNIDAGLGPTRQLHAPLVVERSA
jgi:transcriptional regulator with PAS, ATPase and Fis domain